MRYNDYTFDLNLQAWVKGITITAENQEQALEELKKMSIEDLIEEGYVRDFELSDIDCSSDEDEDEEELDDDFEIDTDFEIDDTDLDEEE